MTVQAPKSFWPPPLPRDISCFQKFALLYLISLLKGAKDDNFCLENAVINFNEIAFLSHHPPFLQDSRSC
jgi:hypothetical protein